MLYKVLDKEGLVAFKSALEKVSVSKAWELRNYIKRVNVVDAHEKYTESLDSARGLLISETTIQEVFVALRQHRTSRPQLALAA